MPYLFRPRKLRTDKEIRSQKSRDALVEFDQMTADPEQASRRTFRQLIAPLKRVPRAERGVEWTERVVIAYCLKRMKSGRVRSLRKSIMQHWQRTERPDLEDRFCKRFDTALQGQNTSHGSYFVQFELEDRQNVAEDLAALIRKLQKLNIEVFINSGTLLGAVRDGTLIGHDDDIDLGLVLCSNTQSAAKNEFLYIFNYLKQHTNLEIKTSFVSPVLKIKLPSDIVVDLFPTWCDNDRIYIWPHTFGELSKEDVFPLTSRELNGISMPAPAKPEKMLALNYGDGWTTPDSDFVFPWKAARIKFKKFLRLYWIGVRLNTVTGPIKRKWIKL